jgi:hypothetical protein
MYSKEFMLAMIDSFIEYSEIIGDHRIYFVDLIREFIKVYTNQGV